MQKALAYALIAFVCVACSSVIPTYDPIVSPGAVNQDYLPEVRNTAEDPVIYRQTFGQTHKATVEEDILINKGNRTYSITPSDELFAASFGDPKETVFCSYAPTYTGLTPFKAKLALQSCLLDHESDGRFEKVFSGHLQFASQSYLDFAAKIDPAIPYRQYSTEPLRGVVLDMMLKIVDNIDGSNSIKLIIDDGMFGRDINYPSFELSGESDFPQKIKMMGAEIELIDFDKGVLTYRVLSGFDADIQLSVADIQ
jgi:hypothetical protein